MAGSFAVVNVQGAAGKVLPETAKGSVHTRLSEPPENKLTSARADHPDGGSE